MVIFPKKYGFFPYVFLIYVFIPVSFVVEESGWKRLIGFGLIVLFIISYRQLYFLEGTWKFHMWLYIQMTIILVLSVFYNFNHFYLGFFPANFISWYKDKRLFRSAILYLAVCIITPMVVYTEIVKDTIMYLFPFFVLILLSPFAYRSMYLKMELEEQLNQANEQIDELIKREERLRIARDLHDTLGHTLSLITLKSQLVAKLADRDANRAISEAKEIERTSRAALSQVRELIDDMRMMTIPEELLEAKALLQAAHISHSSIVKVEFSHIPLLTQNILSMCIREAVTNVVKHSQAKRCEIEITEQAGEIQLCIRDDGKGYPINDVKGNGITGMEERLTIIEGTVNRQNKNGAYLFITVPVISRNKEEGLDDQSDDSRRSTDASRSAFFSS
ncbi:sensor histidine kinase [Pradoshia sp.]